MELQLLTKDAEWGWRIFCFRLFGIGIDWFTDNGEWFIYIGGKHRHIRFSGDGVILFGKNKEWHRGMKG